MEEYDKIEEKAIKKLKPEKPKMKIDGKSAFLLDKLSKEGRESEDKYDKKVSKKDRKL